MLPHLRFMYFSNDIENGYHIHTKFGKDVYQLLENALSSSEGGDFVMIFDMHIPAFEIKSTTFPQSIRCTAYTFLWQKEFIPNLKKIQKFIRSRIIRRKFSEFPRDPFGLRRVKEFIASDKSNALPEEIVELILTHIFQPKSENFHNKLPYRRIETNALKKITPIERERLVAQ